METPLSSSMERCARRTSGGPSRVLDGHGRGETVRHRVRDRRPPGQLAGTLRPEALVPFRVQRKVAGEQRDAAADPFEHGLLEGPVAVEEDLATLAAQNEIALRG